MFQEKELFILEAPFIILLYFIIVSTFETSSKTVFSDVCLEDPFCYSSL